MAESTDRRYQCLLIEPEDVNNPAAVSMMLDARFLDSPYKISEGTRQAGVGIVKAELQDTDQANFLLRDTLFGRIIGHSKITGLYSAEDGVPEMTGIYIEHASRGRHLANLLHQAREIYLQENGYAAVKAYIEDSYEPSLKAALRNGFRIASTKQSEFGSRSYTLIHRVGDQDSRVDLQALEA